MLPERVTYLKLACISTAEIGTFRGDWGHWDSAGDDWLESL